MLQLKRLPVFYIIGAFFITWVACKDPNTAESASDKILNKINIDDLDTLLLAHPDLIIIDVRTDKEVADGIIDNAIQIDFKKKDFKKRIRELDSEKTYLLYCRTNNRSSKAYSIMEQENFKNIYLLSGGYTEWKASQKSD